jgi:glycosyltransferase involved in cell wall biosynthesis
MIEDGWDIIIPTWNNLNHLKLLVRSINDNSTFDHKILVHFNQITEKELEWANENLDEFTFAENNAGLCSGVNKAYALGDKEWLCMIDDDMYVLPDWDVELVKFYREHDLTEKSMLSSFCIEPRPSIFNTTIVSDFGLNVTNFREDDLLQTHAEYKAEASISNTSNCPVLFNRSVFSSIGGYDTDFDPGIGAELGIAKRMWDYGCRNYPSVGSSLVYHFGSMSTTRVSGQALAVKRDDTFINKYGLTKEEFNNTCILKGLSWTKRKDQ